MNTPATVARRTPQVKLPRFLPLFIDEGATAQRTKRAASAFKSRYALLPAREMKR